MKSKKLKRDQIPTEQAQNWRLNLEEEEKFSFNLIIPPIILEKETYLKLTSESDSRVRIYLGLEPEKKEKKYILCAYAVSAFLLGSGDVFRDYESPVFKLDRKNRDSSANITGLMKNIQRYRKWRKGELDNQSEWAKFRKYIYPNGYLMSKYELHEIFITQNKQEAQISFGISKTMDAMIYPGAKEKRSINDQMVFNFSNPCPPYCDESSIYNSEENASD